MSWLMNHPAVLVGLGGALGSNARYWLGRWVKSQPWAANFAWGTLGINITGSLILGIVAALCRDRTGPGFLLFGVGFCGGYTTFSTFSLEVVEMIDRGRVDLAGFYILSSVLGGFLAFWIAWGWTRS